MDFWGSLFDLYHFQSINWQLFLLELLGRWTIASMGVLCWVVGMDQSDSILRKFVEGMSSCAFVSKNIHLITLLQIVSQKIFIFEIRKLTTRSFFSFSISWLCNLIFPNKCPGLCRHFTNHKFLISEE